MLKKCIQILPANNPTHRDIFINSNDILYVSDSQPLQLGKTQIALRGEKNRISIDMATSDTVKYFGLKTVRLSFHSRMSNTPDDGKPYEIILDEVKMLEPNSPDNDFFILTFSDGSKIDVKNIDSIY